MRMPSRRLAPLAAPLHWALLGMAGLLMLTGLVSAWQLHRIDTQYSDLLAQTTENLQHVEYVASHAGAGYAAARELPRAQSAASRSELLKELAAQRQANDQIFAHLEQDLTAPVLRAALEDTMAKRVAARQALDVVLGPSGVSLEGSLPLSRPVAEGAVDPPPAPAERAALDAFVRYQDACTKLTELMRVDSLRASQGLTQDVARFRWLFLSTAALPAVLGFVLLLLTLYFTWKVPVEMDLHS